MMYQNPRIEIDNLPTSSVLRSVKVSLKILSQDNVEEEAVLSDLPQCREEVPGCVITPYREHVVLDGVDHV